MDITVEIHRLVDQYLEHPRDDEEKRLVEASRALPIYRGWGAILLLSETGKVIAHEDEWEEGRFEDAEEPFRTISLVMAAERYPGLKSLLPSRPPGASDCSMCVGKGMVISEQFFCGKCSGLGWVENAT